MSRLTWKEKDGTWGVNGITWNELNYQIQPEQLWKILYGCLYKLMRYEETGLTPTDVDHLQMDYEIRTGGTRWRGEKNGVQKEEEADPGPPAGERGV